MGSSYLVIFASASLRGAAALWPAPFSCSSRSSRFRRFMQTPCGRIPGRCPTQCKPCRPDLGHGSPVMPPRGNMQLPRGHRRKPDDAVDGWDNRKTRPQSHRAGRPRFPVAAIVYQDSRLVNPNRLDNRRVATSQANRRRRLGLPARWRGSRVAHLDDPNGICRQPTYGTGARRECPALQAVQPITNAHRALPFPSRRGPVRASRL